MIIEYEKKVTITQACKTQLKNINYIDIDTILVTQKGRIK